MDDYHEFFSNEDLEETHDYAIIGLAVGIIAIDNKYLFQKIYVKLQFIGTTYL